MRRKKPILFLLLATATITGCNWLTPLIFVGEHKKKVTAEFNKLAGKRVAVLVWAPPETLFDYPYVRFELISHVANKLEQEMTAEELGIDVVDPQDIEDYVQKESAAQVDPRLVGKNFKADYVVYIELLLFQIRDATQPELVQGRISASVTVYDIGADPDVAQSYEMSPVETVHPIRGPEVMTPSNSLMIRDETYRKFAEEVARKFYDHEVDL